MIPRLRTRWFILALVAAVLAGAIFVVARPKPAEVDLAQVDSGPLDLAIESEGRTRVAQTYVVAAPISGRLERMTLEAGDPVVKGQTVLGQMRPGLPALLDARSRAEARAAVDEAEAALTAARVERDAAGVAVDQAQRTLKRTQTLATSGTVTRATLDEVTAASDAAAARLATAEAAVTMREASVARAQSVLDDSAQPDAKGADAVPILSPATGSVLRLLVESETTLPAGTPIVEVGDVTGDLEVVCDLLSRDAVRVRPGQPVTISDWGGGPPLAARVRRVSPAGITKVSALGVEEQRVEVVIGFDGPAADHAGLGHAFQVTARIVIWQAPDVLRVPSGALFRAGAGWAVFAVRDGRAVTQPVTVGANNGVLAEVTAGLSAGETVVLYPSSAVADGLPVVAR